MKHILPFVLITAFLSLFVSCQQEPTFSLIGKTQGLEDGTKLYIRADLKIVDSTEITNNSFEFHTKFESLPVQVVLGTKRNKQYRVMWIDNSPMTFDASQTDNFKEAIITGSENQDLSNELSELTKDISSRKEQLEIEKNFVKEHPNHVYSANILGIYCSTWGKEQTESLYNVLSDEVKNSSYGKDVKRYIDLAVEPKIGDRYVDFTMEDAKGGKVSLSDYEGKVVLLEFWASWCGPCRQENPNLVKTYEKYHPKGFEVLGVSLDQFKSSWIDAIEKDVLPWKHVSDLNGWKNEVALIYGVSGIPDNFLIDAEGKIIKTNLRGEKLDTVLEEIFSQP